MTKRISYEVFSALRLPALAVASACVFSFAANAQEADIDTQSYISVLGSYAQTDDDRTPNPDADEGYGLRLVYGWQYASRFGIGMALESQIIETDIPSFTDFYRHSVELHGTYALGDRTGFTPYALLGVGGNYNDVRDIGESDSFDVYGTAGLGFVTAPIIETGNIKLRGELRYIYDTFADEYQDYQALVGFEIPLFATAEPMEPPPAPEPEVRVVNAELEDEDGDGIPDSADKCPGTPPGTRVDGEGCALSDTIRLYGVLFEYDSAKLQANAVRLLTPVVEIFERYPDLEIEVAGHTDSDGSAEYNQALSQRRAEAVRDELSARGAPAEQIEARGYGEEEPIANNDTPAGREQNRRVEIRILN